MVWSWSGKRRASQCQSGGARRVILNDLSPAATFIAANYNLPFDVDAFAEAGKTLLKEVDEEVGWMYETLHTDGKTKGRIEYTVWSQLYTCPECAGEINFTSEALDPQTKRVKEQFPCPHCGAEMTKQRMERAYVSKLDSVTGETIQTPKRAPALIVYKIGKNRYEKLPDANDLALIARTEALPLPSEVPSIAVPPMHMTHERARMDHAGVTHIHHFFLPRAAYAMALLWRKALAWPDARIREMLLFMVEQAIWGFSVLNRYSPSHFSQVNRALNGVYYVASQHSECGPAYNLGGKLNRLVKAFRGYRAGLDVAAINTGTTASLPLPDASIDYIFTETRPSARTSTTPTSISSSSPGTA